MKLLTFYNFNTIKIMKFKSLKFLGSLVIVLILIIGGAVLSFKINISLRPNTASAYLQPTCSDGATYCGAFGGYTVSGSISCSINGRMNNGWTATCNTGDSTTVIGGPGQQEWLVLSKSGSVTIPSTAPGDSNYNSTTVFPNTPVYILWGAHHAGTVNLGTASDSYDPCSPYAIGKPGCDGFSNRLSSAGTGNPGDVLRMTVTALHADNNMNSTCTPGSDCGQWGAGTASASLDGLTFCYNSSSASNTNYIIPGNPSSGKRNYVATSQGVCTPNNLPVVKIPALSAKWNANNLTSYTITATPGTRIVVPFTFWNSGQSGSTVTVDGTSGCHATSPNIDSSTFYISLCSGGVYTNP